MTRYDVIHNDDDDTYDVVARQDDGRFEGWGSFDTQAEALASIERHKQLKATGQ